MRRIIPIAIAAALLAPQAAQAATLTPLKPCYRSIDEAEQENVEVDAGGFTPGGAVDVLIDGTVIANDVKALPDGSIKGQVSAPFQAKGERAFTLTVTEADKPANTASWTSRVTALAMRIKPKEARPSKKVRFIGRGFTDGEKIYGHYLRGGKVRKTVTLGRPNGPCGTIDVKRRQMPISKPKVGRWKLQVDNQPAYSSVPAGVLVELTIIVRRVLRGG